MSEVAILTDSCASIPDAFYDDLDIAMVPYNLHMGTESKKDLVQISREAFFAFLAKATEIPKTANPGAGDYITAYRDLLADHQNVISIHMTSKGSGAYQAACLAKQSLIEEGISEERVQIVDTMNVSMCHGWMTIEAARAAQAGRSVDDILALIQRIKPVCKMIQTADTLHYLYLGGRIGRAQHLMGSLLQIKPLIGMEDGEIVALGKARTLTGAFHRMVQLMEQQVGSGARIKLALVHVAALEKAEALRQLIEAKFDCVETLFTQLTPVLAVHTGIGTVGLCYFPVDPVGL